MIQLKNYQEKSVEKLVERLSILLKSESDNLTCVFKAPTGSGKTIIMADALKNLVDENNDIDLAFIWITVNKLHDQSKIKIKSYYKDLQTIICSNFDSLQNNVIQTNEILFLNWNSINNSEKIIVRENEDGNNLSNVIQNTKEDGRTLILIIDESHHTANTEKSQDIINDICPKITIEISATPKLSPDDIITISHNEVRNEEMIKKSIFLNHELNDGNDINDEILKKALKKNAELKTQYVRNGSNVNPLVLIQLPNEQKGITDIKRELMYKLKTVYDISVENGKLGIWLADRVDKINIDDIAENDNDVEVLIFKQAIALGWDCPRASILVLFKEWKSITFTIQTIGRIMRMPELKYYDNDELDKAHIYTNVKEVGIIEDFAKDYISEHKCKRNNTLYDNVKLKSTYLQRKHQKTRLSSDFHNLFYNEAEKYKLMKKIIQNPKKHHEKIIIDQEITNSDKETVIRGDTAEFTISDRNMQDRYTKFLQDSVEGFAKHRSSEILRRSIYTFLEKNKINNYDDAQNIVLFSKNTKHFTSIINSTKDEYRKKIVENIKRESIVTPEWEVPLTIDYAKKYNEANYKKFIMTPAIIKSDSQNETNFMNYIDDPNNNVKWWFKNGTNDKKYFAISYIKSNDGLPHSFYTDFIIFMKNGLIYLIDTKENRTAEDSHDKADGLQKYIKNNFRRKLDGGIAVYHKGEWLINNNEKYHYDRNDFSEWCSLHFDEW